MCRANLRHERLVISWSWFCTLELRSHCYYRCALFSSCWIVSPLLSPWWSIIHEPLPLYSSLLKLPSERHRAMNPSIQARWWRVVTAGLVVRCWTSTCCFILKFTVNRRQQQLFSHCQHSTWCTRPVLLVRGISVSTLVTLSGDVFGEHWVWGHCGASIRSS